jgi:hypothetical protein
MSKVSRAAMIKPVQLDQLMRVFDFACEFRVCPKQIQTWNNDAYIPLNARRGSRSLIVFRVNQGPGSLSVGLRLMNVRRKKDFIEISTGVISLQEIVD